MRLQVQFCHVHCLQVLVPPIGWTRLGFVPRANTPLHSWTHARPLVGSAGERQRALGELGRTLVSPSGRPRQRFRFRGQTGCSKQPSSDHNKRNCSGLCVDCQAVRSAVGGFHRQFRAASYHDYGLSEYHPFTLARTSRRHRPSLLSARALNLPHQAHRQHSSDNLDLIARAERKNSGSVMRPTRRWGPVATRGKNFFTAA